ncbi:ribose-5-phosphate isomerase [Tetragenococcus halophilus subsp. flandriensis]|uniref:RpiB/LacA/LacB family sugar-phosphate isomerase n=1 Tax=Tetragenococcus halophilus TaxID=51669 RepID=UPI0023E92A27|nr:RpiB/LacA/LacB family sugar-phosphate isomerase [Tetragenococcus halophilus]GMA09111.1 ribose-5-phosphate isomerase [Tetragenococcus halophilus subsp. flandriensis]
MSNKIALGCDSAGFERKEEIKDYLIHEKNYEVVFDPFSTFELSKGDFTELADDMCETIQKDICRLGIYVCGTGIGFSCQANTHWGIRAVPVTNPYSAKRARLSNNVQILCLGARVTDLEYTKMIIDSWLDEPFDFENARKSSLNTLKKAEISDDKLLRKPDFVAWNMGFKPDK